MLVNQRNIGHFARTDGAGFNAEQLRRAHAHLFDELCKRQNAGLHKCGICRRKRRFHTDGAVWRVQEISFFRRRVRRVVGRDDVDRAVLYGLDHRKAVLLAAQRRVHAVVRVVLFERFIGQKQVVRCGLRRHLYATGFGITDERRRGCRADMADVHRHVIRRSRRNFTRRAAVLRRRRYTGQIELFGNFSLMHDPLFREEQIFAVRRHAHVELRRFA